MRQTSIGGGSTSPDINTPLFPQMGNSDAAQPNNNSTGRQAKVLYDYDAADMSELSLKADEV